MIIGKDVKVSARILGLVTLSAVILMATPFTVSSDVYGDWDDRNDDIGFHFIWNDITKNDLMAIDDDILEDLSEDLLRVIGFNSDDDVIDVDENSIVIENCSLEFGDGESIKDGVLTSIELEILKGKISFTAIVEENGPVVSDDDVSDSHIGAIDEQGIKLKEIVGETLSVGDRIDIVATFEMISIEEDIEEYASIDENRAIKVKEESIELERFDLKSSTVTFTKIGPVEPKVFEVIAICEESESEGVKNIFDCELSQIVEGTEYTEKEFAEIETFEHKSTLKVGDNVFNFSKKKGETEPPESEREEVDDDDIVFISQMAMNPQAFERLSEKTLTVLENKLSEADVSTNKSFKALSDRITNYAAFDPDNDDPAEEKGISTTLIIVGVVAGIVVVAGLAYVLIGRR